MADRASEKKKAVELIRSAFAGVDREGGTSLHQAQVLDDYGSDEELRAAAALDADRRWEDVPSHDIESHTSALSFVDPIGFRYYIAAYMVWSLEHYESSDSFSVDHTIYSLSSSMSQEDRFDLLSREQVHAITGFLQYMAEHSAGLADQVAASEALSGYWKHREAADS
jgi:hypothetical protein